MFKVNWTMSNMQVFKWSGFNYGHSYSHNHLKTGPIKLGIFSRFQMVFEKWRLFVCISDSWASRFRSHSKSRPFVAQTLFDRHSKSRLVHISDPQYTWYILESNSPFSASANIDLRSLPNIMGWVFTIFSRITPMPDDVAPSLVDFFLPIAT